MALDLDDVEVALADLAAVNENLAEEANAVALLGRCGGEAVDEHLMKDPCLMVHVLLI